MITKIGDTMAFQIAERCWRPFQQWGFAVAAVCYALRPLFELSFNIQVFAALATASGVGFIGRGIEKVARANGNENSNA